MRIEAISLACTGVLAVCVLCLIAFWNRRSVPRSVFLGIVLLIGLAHAALFRTISEDAYIGLRFSQNLARGMGLVFNAGERVEGYSNFLWTAFLGVLHRATGWDLPSTAAASGTVMLLAGLVATFVLARRLTRDWRIGILCAFCAACSGSYVAYGPSALEGPLFALLILLFFLALTTEHWVAAGVLMGLAIMTRPDGVLLAPVIILFTWLTPKPMAWKARVVLSVATAALALVLPWTIWRLSYYGYFIPNAMAAKRGMNLGHQVEAGLSYGLKFAVGHFPVFAAALAIIALPWIQRRERKKAEPIDLCLLGFVVLFGAFVVLVGGDWMPGWRFFSPVVPILMIVVWRFAQLSVPGFSALAERTSFVTAVAGGGVLMVAVITGLFLVPRFRAWDSEIQGLAEIGRWFHATLPGETLTACFPCGAFPYYSELPTLDMLGLVDVHIARHGKRNPFGPPGHIAHDYDYVASRKPPVVAFLAGGNGFDRRIHADSNPEFQKDYVPVSFRFPERDLAEGQYVNLLVLRSEEARLAGALLRFPGIERVSELTSQRNGGQVLKPGVEQQ